MIAEITGCLKDQKVCEEVRKEGEGTREEVRYKDVSFSDILYLIFEN